MDSKVVNGATEMDTFLPQDGSNKNGTAKYKIKAQEDFEAANAEFDPFKARSLEHPVSDCDTLTHLLKASLGTGILSMPAAFKASGLILGIFSTIAVSILCTHCAYILVVCAHELYKRSGKTAMSFADVAEEACKRGPAWSKPLAPYARQSVLIGLFVTYFATCSCYTVIIALNFNAVVNYYMGREIDERITIALLLVPLLLLSYVPNLKYLAPFSMAANIFMGIGLCITLYYLMIDLKPIDQVAWVGNVSTLPISVSITIFAIEAIGVVMPLENHMEKPRHFVGLCGVLNQGMSGVTLVYILLGFFGYLSCGDATEDSITLNLPKKEYPAQAVLILIGLAVFCTFGLQFYVCLDIAWNGIKDYFPNKPSTANYVMRTVMVAIAVILAIAVPTIVPFVGLIGAFCFSILGLMSPVFIETITFWEKGFGKYNWKIVKNVIIVFVGIIALIFGSKSALQDIYNLYAGKQNSTMSVNS